MVRDPKRLERFEHITSVPLTVLALAMIPVLLAPEITELSPAWSRIVSVAGFAIWAVFAADLAIRTYLAPRRLHYLAHHPVDVLIVVIPFLRPLRALRAVRLLYVALYFVPSTRTVRALAARKAIQGALLFAVLTVTVATFVVWYAEREAGGPIDGIDTAAWWALATVTTVGYGDVVPQTYLGRGAAIVLMLVGIGLFGLLTAQVAAFFVETSHDED